MEKQIHPNPWIIEALSSEIEHATPFSRIPGFVKKYAIRKEQETELVSILSSVWEKELSYLGTRIEKIHNLNCGQTPDMYEKIIHLESGKDKNGNTFHSKLEKLAKQIIASEMWAPVYQILKDMKVEMNTWIIDPSTFDNHHIDISQQLSELDKDLVHQEQQVRVIMNALIMWAGHRIFDKVDSDSKYAQSIKKINPDLYQSYYDMVYTNLKHMWESTPNWAWVNTGSMELSPAEDGTKIHIKADMFPVLLHEMAKWVIEYMAYTRYNNLSPEITQSILSVDSRESEHRMMLVWPQIYKQLFFLIKESIAQYNETKWVLAQKEESDYIMPIFSRLVQLPATDFLAFMEMILRQDQSGAKPIACIKNIIQDIDLQYALYLESRPSQPIEITIHDIVKQLIRELEIDRDCQNFIETSVSRCKDILESDWFGLSDKKMARKLAEYFPDYIEKYGPFDGTVDDAFFVELQDTIRWFTSSRVEQLAFGNIHEQQKKFPKRTKNHEWKSINIHPRFPLSALEEAKENISSEQLDGIRNKVADLIQKWTLQDWFADHDEISTINSNLTERFITLDSTVPECIMEWEGNRWLYKLTTLEQLKRESGSMWWHCVADYINSVSRWEINIYSLRLGTESRWTIGYRPSNHEIIQVKWYTNRQKNAIISDWNPDYNQLLETLKYLTKTQEVEQINDIFAIYNNGYLLTNKWLLCSEEFIKTIQQDNHNIKLYQWSKYIFVNEDVEQETIKKLCKIDSVSLIFDKYWEYSINYDLSNKKLSHMPIKDKSSTADESLLNKLKSLCLQLEVSSIQGMDPLFYTWWLFFTNKWLLSPDEFIELFEKGESDDLVIIQGDDIHIPDSVSPEALKKLSDLSKKVLRFKVNDVHLDYSTTTKIITAYLLKNDNFDRTQAYDVRYFEKWDPVYTKLQELAKTIWIMQIKWITNLDNGEYLYTNDWIISPKEFAPLFRRHWNSLRILNPNSTVEVPISLVPGYSKNIISVRFTKWPWVITWKNDLEQESQYIESIRNEQEITYSSYANAHVDRALHNDHNRNKHYAPIIAFLNTIVKKIPGYIIKDLDHLYAAGTLIRTKQWFYSPQEFIDTVDTETFKLFRDDAAIALPENISMDIVHKLLAKYPDMNYLFTVDWFCVRYHNTSIQSLSSFRNSERLWYVYKSDEAKKVLKHMFTILPVSYVARDSYFIKTDAWWVEPQELVVSTEQEAEIILKSNRNNFYFDIHTDISVLHKLLSYTATFHFLVPGVEGVVLDYQVSQKSIDFMEWGTSTILNKEHPHYETLLTAIITISRKVPVLAVSKLSRDFKDRWLIVTNSWIVTEKHYLQLLENHLKCDSWIQYSWTSDWYRSPQFPELDINSQFSSPKITPLSTTPENVINYLTKKVSIELDLTSIPQEIKNKITRINWSLTDLSDVVDYPQLKSISGFCNVSHATILHLKSLDQISRWFIHMPWNYIKDLDLSSLEQINERDKYTSHKTTQDLQVINNQSYDMPLLSEYKVPTVENVKVEEDTDLPF